MSIVGTHRGVRGFSLVEVMLVMALITVLISLAMPAYREQAARAHRVVAISTLLQAAACQARVRQASGQYDVNRCRPAANQRYHFRYLDQDGAAGYVLRAEPLDGQAVDHCGWLSLDHTGRRGAEHAEAGSARCWSGR